MGENGFGSFGGNGRDDECDAGSTLSRGGKKNDLRRDQGAAPCGYRANGENGSPAVGFGHVPGFTGWGAASEQEAGGKVVKQRPFQRALVAMVAIATRTKGAGGVAYADA